MQISNLTLEIFKNFSTINPNFGFDGDGTIIRTQSPLKDIIAWADIEETLPSLYIYDLRSFLNTVALVGENPIFDFKDNLVNINNPTAKRKARFAYCDASLIDNPKKTANIPPFDTIVELSKETITSILNAARVIGVGEVVFRVVNENTVLLCAESINSKTDRNPNSFSIEIEAVKAAAPNTTYSIKLESFKFIPGNYRVGLCNKGIAEFGTVLGNQKTLRYWTPVTITA